MSLKIPSVCTSSKGVCHTSTSMSLTVFRVFINCSTILYSSINATLTNPFWALVGDAYVVLQPFGLFHQLLFSERAVTPGFRPSHFLSAVLQFSGLLLQCLFLEGVSACRFRPSHFLSGKERLEKRS